MLAMTEEANEYRQKFHKYYYEKIVNDLVIFEYSRKKELNKWATLVILAIIAIISGLGILIFVSTGKGSLGDTIGKFAIIIACGLIYFAQNISKDFENNIKLEIMQSFLSFFGDFFLGTKRKH